MFDPENDKEDVIVERIVLVCCLLIIAGIWLA